MAGQSFGNMKAIYYLWDISCTFINRWIDGQMDLWIDAFMTRWFMEWIHKFNYK